MPRLATPEIVPELTIKDMAGAFMADHIARHHIFVDHLQILDISLCQSIGELIDSMPKGGSAPCPETFIGHRAKLLLQGLKRVIDTTHETDWRHGQAQDMFDESQYQAGQLVVVH